MLLGATLHAMLKYTSGRMAKGTRNVYRPSLLRIEKLELHADRSITKLLAASLPLSNDLRGGLRVMRLCDLHKGGWFHNRI